MSPDWFRRATPSRVDFLFQHLKPGRVLDLGNLGGDASPHPLLQARADGMVVGLDIDLPKALQRRYPRQVVGAALVLPFRNGTFDTLYVGELLEHVCEPYACLREMRRVLKLDGMLILDTPNPLALERMMRWLVLGQSTLGDADHKFFYVPAMLERLLAGTGFSLLEITTDAKIPIGPLRLRPLPRWPFFARLGSHLCLVALRGPDGAA